LDNRIERRHFALRVASDRSSQCDDRLIAKNNQLNKSSQRFQTIVARLRRHRVAVLIDANDTDWQGSCLRIIEYLSQVWGGAHSLIIPTNGDTIDNCFWELLSSFDPDIICRYQKTGYDLFMATGSIVGRSMSSNAASRPVEVVGCIY
jgi:hypothetical protein